MRYYLIFGDLIRASLGKPYADRLQALQEAQSVYSALLDATYEMERAVPNERLALFDRLWFSHGDSGPFITARNAWAKLDQNLEQWGQELQSEATNLCRDILGIELGDIVIIESGSNLVRVSVEGINVHSSDDQIFFSVWGTRYRKDGLPGKRTEHFSIAYSGEGEHPFWFMVNT